MYVLLLDLYRIIYHQVQVIFGFLDLNIDLILTLAGELLNFGVNRMCSSFISFVYGILYDLTDLTVGLSDEVVKVSLQATLLII